MWSLRFNAEASLEVLMFATLVASQKFCTAPEISVGGVKKKKEKEKKRTYLNIKLKAVPGCQIQTIKCSVTDLF